MSDAALQVYNGRYELQRKLARGGMADVFLARDQLLDRPVALKVLFPEFATDPAFVERFRREAQSAANLSHPNVVSVYDWGEEEGTYYIVMEYIEGPSLAQQLRESGPLAPERAVSVTDDVAAALGFAHRNGVVHRDVKPGNVLLAPGGVVKVADFGIARAVSTAENLTQTGTVMGTATYFSPEQARGEAVDQRSDIYSLGIVLYEMLVGAPPFSGDSPLSVAYKHVQEPPEPPRTRNPSVPAALEAITLKCVAKDPDARYSSAEDLRADLARYRDGASVLAAPPVQEATTVVQAATRVAPATIVAPPVAPVYRRVEEEVLPPVAPPARSSAGFFVTLGVLLLVLLVLLYFFARQLGLLGGDDAADQVEVPSVIDLTQGEAVTLLSEDGFRVTTVAAANDSVAEGLVFDQDPEAGQNEDEGSEVTVTVSSGRPPIEVPTVVGLTEEEAERELFVVGLGNNVQLQPDEEVETGRVITQNPAAGQQLPPESVVQIIVSSGRPAVAVPDVVNQTRDQASNALGREGFQVEVREEFDDAPEGTVLATEPEVGSEQPDGATVTLVVSAGPEPTTTTTSTTTTSTTAPTTTTTRPTTTSTSASTTTSTSASTTTSTSTSTTLLP